jgi:CBS domain-containing protein
MTRKVHQIMSKQVISVEPDTKVTQIWKLIFAKHIHGLPVVDKSDKLLGIISEEDILKKLYPEYSDAIEDFSSGSLPDDIEEKLEKLKGLKASDIMSKRVIYTRHDTLIMRALSRMIVRQVRQLPVLDDDNKLVGMISKGDIFDNIFKLGFKKKTKK